MNTQELRIGNLVYVIGRAREIHIPIETPVQVFEVGMLNSEILTIPERPEKTKVIKIPNLDLIPIPITPEWLERFGFDFDFDTKRYTEAKIKEWRMSIQRHEKKLLWIVNPFKTVEIKYVNQIQNLYFALTGEELTVKRK